MTPIKNITTAQPYLTLLPDHEVVFAPSSLFLAQHLLPLISIDLSAINTAWQGKIHLLNAIEPYEGYIGSDTTEFSDTFANENWFIMQLNQQNQYEWLANKRYFALENPDCEADLKTHHKEMHEDYLQLKQRFAETGKIISTSRIEYQNNSPTTLLDQLGGECGGGNWTYPIDQHFDLRYINADRDDQEVHISDRDGNRYYFIAAVAGWEYCSRCADSILLYYQPET